MKTYPKYKTFYKRLFPVNPFWFAIPATLDNVGCTLMYIALTECAASVYQMMRGFIVVFTAALTVCFLKRK